MYFNKLFKIVLPAMLIVGLPLPFFLTYLVDPEWLGRMFGVACFNYLGLGLFAWFVLDKRIEPQNMQSVGARLYGQKAMKRVDFVLRGFLLLIAVVGLPYAMFGTTKDILFLVQNGEPMVMTDKVTRTYQNHFGLGGILDQEIVLEKMPSKRWRIKYHYPPLKPDEKTYEFLYVPNTEQILEVREIAQYSYADKSGNATSSQVFNQ